MNTSPFFLRESRLGAAAIQVARRVFPAFAFVGALGLAACGDEAEAEDASLTVAFSNLPVLAEGYVYESWLIVDDAPVAAGRFSAEGDADVALEDVALLDASAYILTIEPEPDSDPGPSAVHLLAGDFSDGEAQLTSDDARAIGADLETATGNFILETPTTTLADDYDQGVWFLDPSAGPGPSLSLPELADGWAYEGWVVLDGTPVSTGRFTDVAAADADGAGSSAGPETAPPFPGQDFINPAEVLSESTVVISVEPEPDDSAAPFFLKPLVGEVSDAGAGTLQALSQNADANALSGVARLTGMNESETD